MNDLFTFTGDRALPGAVLRYRVMAYIVGTALLILTAIVICQYVFDLRSAMKTPEMIVAPVHGYLYIVYLVAAADLARRARWHLGRIVLVVCSGFVPFLAFIIEHRVHRQMEAEFAAEAIATGEPGAVDTNPAPTAVGPTD